LRRDVVRARSFSPEWLPWAVLAGVIPVLSEIPITHDAIWQMWLGRQMLGGVPIYRNIIEVNPPLWFWIAVPLAALHLDPRLTIIGFFIASMAFSLWLIPQRYRLPALAVFVILPLPDFGQREHFALIASAPYVFAIASRRRDQQPRHPAVVGLFAAVGLCLKPHFLLVPLALEAFIWRAGRFRVETIALVAFGVAYAVAIPLFARDYLTVMLPMIRTFYGSFAQRPAYFDLAGALILATAGTFLGRRRGDPEIWALLVASAAFLPAVFLQGKGFAYHSIPVRGFLALAILVALAKTRSDPVGDALLVGSVLFCCLPTGVYRSAFRNEAERHIAGVQRGTSVIALVTNPSMIWPMVDEHRLDWQLHAFSVWQLDAAANDPDLLPEVRAIYAPDLAKRPNVLIIDNRAALGHAAHSLLPDDYLHCYALKLRTVSMESYKRVC